MLEDAVADAARRLGMAGRSAMLAVSGGVDSSVLALALHARREELALELAIGHVNHGLRGCESDTDEAEVRALAGRLGLPFRVRRVAPDSLRTGQPSRSRPTLQEAARRLRYDALEEMTRAHGADRIVTAHNQNDQAETVLLRLLRGSGPDGLGGIPERSPDGRIVRPLLGVSREEIEQHARARGLSWREDASNRDPTYARARLRHGPVPRAAADLNPRWLRAISDLAEAQRGDSEWIAQQVDREAKRFLAEDEQGLRIERVGWTQLADPLARRLARRILHGAGAGRDVRRVHLARIVEFLRRGRTGAVLQLPGGSSLHCERGAFRLQGASWQAPPRC